MTTFYGYLHFFEQHKEVPVYVLLDKSDCEGEYSVNNSKQICEVINLIRPLITNENDIKLVAIYEPIFIHSINTNEVVTLS
jgi:hypothetical protein